MHLPAVSTLPHTHTHTQVQINAKWGKLITNGGSTLLPTRTGRGYVVYD